jgi:hypothetical protein
MTPERRMRAVYVLTVLGFLALWQTTHATYWIFTDDRWRLIGYGCFAAAALTLINIWRR